eukprot:scaffold1169_cov120-Cylindrotheca_fusiformis.AAC.40
MAERRKDENMETFDICGRFRAADWRTDALNQKRPENGDVGKEDSAPILFWRCVKSNGSRSERIQ